MRRLRAALWRKIRKQAAFPGGTNLFKQSTTPRRSSAAAGAGHTVCSPTANSKRCASPEKLWLKQPRSLLSSKGMRRGGSPTANASRKRWRRGPTWRANRQRRRRQRSWIIRKVEEAKIPSRGRTWAQDPAQKLPDQNFSSGVRHGHKTLRETPPAGGCACWPGAPRDLHDPSCKRARVLTTRVADHLPPRAVA